MMRLSISKNRPPPPKQSHWTTENVKNFFDAFGKKNRLNQLEDWYKIKTSQVAAEKGGKTLLKRYKNSLTKALTQAYPEYDWKIWKFEKTPQRYWIDEANQRQLFDWAAHQLKISQLDGWYNVTLSDIRRLGNGMEGVLNRFYGRSVSRALTKLYPDHDWKIWKFKQVPKGFWDNETNVKQYLSWLGEQVGAKTVMDWYDIPSQQINSSLLQKTGGVFTLLSKYFPVHNSSTLSYALTKYKGSACSKMQLFLFKKVQELFPNSEIILNYRNPTLLFPTSNSEMELDIYVKDFMLGIEYNGEQHYQFTPVYGNHEDVQSRDQAKLTVCKNQGITVIAIPFWWDRSTSSLYVTILQHRPDLISVMSVSPQKTNGTPIPSTIPASFAKKYAQRNQLHEKMRKLTNVPLNVISSLSNMDAYPFECTLSSRNETYRVYWNGSQMVRCNGDHLDLPQNIMERIKACFGDLPLDAEIRYCHIAHSYCLRLNPNTRYELLSDNGPKMLDSAPLRYCDLMQFLEQHPSLYQYVQFRIYDLPDQTEAYQQRASRIKNAISAYRTSHADNLFESMVETSPPSRSIERLLIEMVNLEDIGEEFPVMLDPKAKYFDNNAVVGLQNHRTTFGLITTKSKKGFQFELMSGKICAIDLAPSHSIYNLLQPGQVILFNFWNYDTKACPSGVRINQILAPSMWEYLCDTSIRRSLSKHSSAQRDKGYTPALSPLSYFVTRGKRNGKPRCRVCKRLISDQSEPRIVVKGAYVPFNQQHPIPAKFTVCLKDDCFNQFAEDPKQSAGFHVPSFQKMIAVCEDIKESIGIPKTPKEADWVVVS